MELLKLSQENEELKQKKDHYESDFEQLKNQMEEIQKIYDSYFGIIDEENEKREEDVVNLESELLLQNEEIEKFKLEKKQLIEEYDSKLNLKNIRYELEMDDYLRSKEMLYGTEMKPKTINKNKFSDMKIINEECRSKTILKYE